MRGGPHRSEGASSNDDLPRVEDLALSSWSRTAGPHRCGKPCSFRLRRSSSPWLTRGSLGFARERSAGDFSWQLSAPALVDGSLEVKAAGFAFIPQPLVEGKTN